jgi:S-adenosylmethionine:tRNA ribosyltransferase-isomerase
VRLEELDFDLPPELIAQTPADPRDSCRLMHLTSSGAIDHAVFCDLPGMLRRGDTLVFNDSKVLPARVLAKKPSGGMVELLFLRPLGLKGEQRGERWEALVRPSKRLRVGTEVLVAGTERLMLSEELGEGRWGVSGAEGSSLVSIMETHGRLPLPPYIADYPKEPSSYQTVYAAVLGSAAAPTAGLHFTHELLQRLEARGVESAWVTLHVGLDTFLPIRESIVEEHHIHTESYEVPSATVDKIWATRARGGRVVAVGTTVTRVLETLGQAGALGMPQRVERVSGSTAIFITPGYQFLAVDALLTNFHLPRSTVLTLTMAFAGEERVKDAYREAIAHGYRFFSFGDAMLIDKVDHVAAGGQE